MMQRKMARNCREIAGNAVDLGQHIAINADFLAEPQWGSTSLTAVGGVWPVIVALAAAIAVLIATSFKRLPALSKLTLR